MQRSYKLILSVVIVLLAGAFAFGQENVTYKEVVLDGKPARLNMATGEITLVSLVVNDTITKPKEAIATDAKETIIDAASDFHIVKQGERLLDIAVLYNASIKDLKESNNLETTLVDEGQKLRVRNFDSVEAKVSSKPNTVNRYVDYYIVEKGNTLYSIAKQYGISVNELKQQNNLYTNAIKVGQKLSVNNFNKAIVVDDVSVWLVAKGDTLYSIAKQNNTTVEKLKSLNKLKSNLIKPGQKLRLK
jgi:LysM repeat protein